MTKLAVAVIHGMGRHEKAAGHEADSLHLTYSRPLRDGLRRILGAAQMDRHVVWREIFWADTLQDRQDALIERTRGLQRVGAIRRFIMDTLGDPANYAYARSCTSTYQHIHARIRRVMRELDADAEGGPLLILAHSLGGHIMSNYLWDTAQGRLGGANATPFMRLDSFAGLVTFGCNIPIFTLQIRHFKPFVPKAASDATRLLPWWRNHNFRADLLGYPMAPVGGGYDALVSGSRPQLVDAMLAPGWSLLARTPFSHQMYWTNRELQTHIAGTMREALARQNLTL